MKPDEYKLTDWHRLLFGSTPSTFLVEALLRTVIIFLLLLVAVRLLGKRMNGQMTITEMAVMLTLGAIVATGMQMADRGLLQAVFVLFCAVLFQRGLTWLESRSSRVEGITEGVSRTLVKQGILQLDALHGTRVSRDQLFAVLRGKEIFSLGSVKRVYLEACGIFSVFKADEPVPGLSLLLENDPGSGDPRRAAPQGVRSCKNCGYTAPVKSAEEQCPHCGLADWDSAVL